MSEQPLSPWSIEKADLEVGRRQCLRSGRSLELIGVRIAVGDRRSTPCPRQAANMAALR